MAAFTHCLPNSIQANFRRDLGSTDSLVATYAFRKWLVLLHGGVSSMKHPDRDLGFLAMGGRWRRVLEIRLKRISPLHNSNGAIGCGRYTAGQTGPRFSGTA